MNNINLEEIGTVIRVTELLNNGATIRQFFEPEITIANIPTPEQSNEIVRELSATDEEFPIDEILGKYFIEANQIKIYSEAIRQVSDILKVNHIQITYIVELHEKAHAMVYQGIPNGISVDDQNNYIASQKGILNNISPGIHEQLAQLITWHILQNGLHNAHNAEYREWYSNTLNVFDILESKQPRQYQISRRLKAIETPKILNAFLNMKSLSSEQLWTKGL